MSKLDMYMYLYIPPLLPFMTTNLSPLLTMGLQILFSDAVNATASFLNVLYTNCSSCTNVS